MTNGLKKIITKLANGVLLLVSMYAFSSCNDVEERMDSTEVSYVSFTTRAQGTDESINTDTEDHEDQVATVRLMAFDHISGAIRHNRQYTLDYLEHNNIPMKVGTYDFYFVANETASLTTALDGVHHYDDLYQVDAIAEIPFNDVAVNPGENEFLMTAVIENQTVTTAHVNTNPLPVSVVLIRALAKVSLKVRYYDKANDQEGKTGATNGLTLTSITVNNIPETYSLFPPKAVYAGTMKTAPQALDISAIDTTKTTVLTTHFYIPEYLRASGTPDAENTSITIGYTKHGIDRTKTAVIDHIETQSSDYYTPANWSDLTHYSVVRNTNYTLTVNMIGWEEEAIAFNWEVLPWTLISSAKDFSHINVENITGEVNDQPGIETGTESNIVMMHTGATQQLDLRFKVLSPAGAVWRFTITNTLDFELTGNPGTSGIAGEQEIILTIRSLKPWTGTIRATELYLTINGEEVQIVPDFAAQGIKPGPTKRYMIQQVI